MIFPKVSILTTVYNRKKYLAACTESLLAGTYQEWELIIVNNQFMDKYIDIAKVYIAKVKRIRIEINETNLREYSNSKKFKK